MVNFPEDYAKQEKYYASESYQTYAKAKITNDYTERQRQQEILATYFGQPKKGDYIPGKKGTCNVWNGTNWVYRGQSACKAHGTGTE